jgi:hypothetical protein
MVRELEGLRVDNTRLHSETLLRRRETKRWRKKLEYEAGRYKTLELLVLSYFACGAEHTRARALDDLKKFVTPETKI